MYPLTGMDATGPIGFLRTLFLPSRRSQAPEPIPEMPKALQDALQSANRCTACGRCDLVFDAFERTSRKDFPGPMAFVLGFARQGNVTGLGELVVELEKGNLAELARECPVSVPFPQLAQALKQRTGPVPLERLTHRPQKRHDPG